MSLLDKQIYQPPPCSAHSFSISQLPLIIKMAFKLQTPVNHPEERKQHSEHGESLKSRKNFKLVDEIKGDDCEFLKFIISVTDCHRHYLLRAQKNNMVISLSPMVILCTIRFNTKFYVLPEQ
jgi:hypothetical protein